MAEAEALQRQLLEAQNPDGGWGYVNGSSSWTEPTALSVLALEAQGLKREAFQHACRWLMRTQRSDGGWPPNASVPTSTWVTSLAALALFENGLAADQHHRAIGWLLGQMQPPLNPVAELVLRFRSAVLPPEPQGGSPWFPGTAAWIAPTALSILALSQADCRNGPSPFTSSVLTARQYILSRRCRDGGWNHGGSRFLAENATSYPEMTGMALLALAGVPDSELVRPLKIAEAQLAQATSNEARCWLQLALKRHNVPFTESRAELPCRSTRDIALRLLALAGDSPRNGLITATA